MSEYTRESTGGLALVGRMLAREGRRDELLQLLEEAVELCAEHEADGALSAAFHISPSNPDLIVLYEHYPSRAALEAHRANYERIPAYGKMRSRMNGLLAAPIEIVEAVRPVVRFSREATGAPSREANRHLIQRFYAAENARDFDTCASSLAPDVEVWGNGQLIRTGREAQIQHSRENFAAFPDWQLEVFSLLAAGDTVVARWHGSGTHSASDGALPATGKRIDIFGTTSFEIRDGLIQFYRFALDTSPLRELASG